VIYTAHAVNDASVPFVGLYSYSYIDRTELHARIDNSSYRSLLTYTVLSKYGRDVAPH